MKKISRLFFFLLFIYIVFCQSCLTFRMSYKETNQFFNSNKIQYIDSNIKINNHTIHFIETGDANKPTIFFIHGSPGSWDSFKKYLIDSELISQFRMISIDRPGFGFSDFSHAENLKIQTSLIAQFIRIKNNNQSVFLVGHSIAGALVVSIGCNFSDKIKKIVILAGAVDPTLESPEHWRKMLKLPPFRYLIPTVLSTSNDELWWLKKDLYLLQKELPMFTSEVLIIHGDNDQLVPYKNVFYIKKYLINAQKIALITIPNANHFIPWTHFNLIKQNLLTINH